ncbi:MAG: PIN domain-containing protein [Pseudonocardia sp.]
MIAAVPETLAVIDTDVFSHVFVRRGSQSRRDLRDRLIGRIPAIATQSRAELLAWPQLRGWAPDRARQLTELIDTTTTVPVTDDVVAAYVELQVSCVRSGHALGQKIHASDRWIAATAIALDRPLISSDAVFHGAPGLKLG